MTHFPHLPNSCQGLYSATPSGGFVPGLEFSGTVLRVGKGVKPIDNWAPTEGSKVMCICELSERMHACMYGRTCGDRVGAIGMCVCEVYSYKTLALTDFR